MPLVSCYFDYTIATKLQGWHSRSWLCPGPVPLYQSNHWFCVKHELQDWTDGPGGSVNLSHLSTHNRRRGSAALNEKGEVDLEQPWTDLDPNYPLVETSIIFTMVFRSLASSLEWKTCCQYYPKDAGLHLATVLITEGKRLNKIAPCAVFFAQMILVSVFCVINSLEPCSFANHDQCCCCWCPLSYVSQLVVSSAYFITFLISISTRCSSKVTCRCCWQIRHDWGIGCRDVQPLQSR